jgi:ABC-type nickel/cobalt efflux system permease component RcnA
MMYNLQDASPSWMAVLFCVLLVIVGAWFLLNVILAVIMEAFEKIDTNQEKEQQKERQDLRDLKKAHGIVDSVDNSEEEDCPSGRAAANEADASKAEAE